MSQLQEEREELAEDEEKLQIALQEYGHEWLSDVDEEEEDDEDRLLIDLDYQFKKSYSDLTGGHSTNSSVTGSGSQNIPLGHEDDSHDFPTAPNLPSTSSKDIEGPEAEKTLALNQALQGILEKHIEDIEFALEANKAKQEMLERGCLFEENNKNKGRTFGPFRSPYFLSGTSLPPVNEDVKLKKQAGELSYEDMHERLALTRRTRELLMEGILEDFREQLLKPPMARLEAEIKKAKQIQEEIKEIEGEILIHSQEELKSSNKKKHSQKSAAAGKASSPTKAQSHKAAFKEEAGLLRKRKQKQDQDEIIAALEEEIEKMRLTDVNHLLSEFNEDSVDWMKISKRHFGDKTSWVDCKKAWEHMVNPKLNQEPWKKEEEKQLLELVEKYPAGQWDLIAKELGNNRTPFLCFHHYQRTHNPDLKPRPWSQSEDKYLVEVTKRLKEEANVFSWRKVSALVESRNSAECQYRYSRLDEDLNHGRWTKLEDAQLLAAVEMLGCSWSRISRIMSSRSAIQCRDRYRQCLNPSLNFRCFTYDEDAKLLKLRKEGMAWSKMVKHFEGRSDNMLVNRWRTLESWRKDCEWWENQSPDVQKMLLGKNLTSSEKFEHKKDWKHYSSRLGIGERDYERQRIDLKNEVPPDLIPPRPPAHLRYNRFSKIRRNWQITTWTNKLALQEQLSENLKLIIAKEQMKIDKGRLFRKEKGKKEKDEFEEDEIIKKIVSDTASETLKSQEVIPPQKYNDMRSALNRYFLGDGGVSVKELLDSCRLPVKKKGRKKRKSEKGWQVNAELKRILRTKNKTKRFEKGRVRKILPRDRRAGVKLEAEAQDVTSTLPSLFFDCLGSSFSSVYSSVKNRSLDIEEEWLKRNSVKEDKDYIDRANMLERRIKEIESNPFMDSGRKKREIQKLKKILKRLQLIFQNYYSEKKKQLNSSMEEINQDVQYLDNLQKRLQEHPPVWTLASDNVAGTAADILSSSLTSAALQSLDSQDGAEDTSQKSDTGSEKSGSRTASLRKRKPPLHIQSSTRAKKPRHRSLVEVEKEREKIAVCSRKLVTDTPYLPPNACTLNTLRVLLLNRQDLMKTAGELYSVENYRKKPQDLKIIDDGRDVNVQLRPVAEENENHNAFQEQDDDRRQLEMLINKLGLEKIEKTGYAPDLRTENAILSSFSPSLLKDASSRKSMPSNSVGKERSGHLDLHDAQLKRNIAEIIPPKKNSAYEVAYGVAAHSRLHKYIADKESEKLPAGKPTASSSSSPMTYRVVVSAPEISMTRLPSSRYSKPQGQGQQCQETAGSSNTSSAQQTAVVVDAPTEKDKSFTNIVGAGQTIKKLADRRMQSLPSLDKIVVVGLDQITNKVIHYKADPDTTEFKPIETISQKEVDEFPIILEKEQSTSRPAENSQAPGEKINPNIIQGIRQTVEYKALAARFRSLFMWPVLISTLMPPDVSQPTAEQLEQAQARREEERGGNKKHKMAETKKMMKSTQQKAKEEAKAEGITQHSVLKEPRRRRRKWPAPDEPRNERPVRQVRLRNDKPQSEKPHPTPHAIPSWWKDAVMEVMMTKQAIEQGKIINTEMNLSDDEDFQAKGNYSDDEWLASLREEESRKEKGPLKKGRRTKRQEKERDVEGEDKGMEGEGREVEEVESSRKEDEREVEEIETTRENDERDVGEVETMRVEDEREVEEVETMSVEDEREVEEVEMIREEDEREVEEIETVREEDEREIEEIETVREEDEREVEEIKTVREKDEGEIKEIKAAREKDKREVEEVQTTRVKEVEKTREEDERKCEEIKTTRERDEREVEEVEMTRVEDEGDVNVVEETEKRMEEHERRTDKGGKGTEEGESQVEEVMAT